MPTRSVPGVRSALLTIVLAASPGGASAAAIPFPQGFDGTFDPAGWEVVEVQGGEGGSVLATQIDDPDPARGKARSIQHTLNPSTGPSSITGVHLKVDAIYDPALLGTPASFEYAEQSRLVEGGGQGQATGPAIRQPPTAGGNLFAFSRADRFFTPSFAWTHQVAHSVVATDFTLIQGSAPYPDFSQPFQVGFYRASSNPTAFGGGSLTAAIDDWSVTFFPPCTSPADCDDGDACTIGDCVDGLCRLDPLDCDDGDACTVDACSAGACTHSPLDCDDGKDCTQDLCSNGLCYSTTTVDFATVEAKIPELLAILEGPSCQGDLLAKKVARKIRKKVKQAGARIGRADDATREAAVGKLLGKADALLEVAAGVVEKGAARGLVSPGCAADLYAFLAELRQCVVALPRG